jgi:hypothetical protein
MSYADAPGRAAVAWLRENGRYLTPTGAGDNLYAAAVIVRNWLAMQYVIGSAAGHWPPWRWACIWPPAPGRPWRSGDGSAA